MRRPKRRGAPVDGHRIQGWVTRFPGYRQEVNPSRIQAWLRQFRVADQDLAARVLDCVNYVTLAAMDLTFTEILSRLPGWDHAKSRRVGTWRFVAFSRVPGESGHRMLHVWRSATGLSGSRHDELFIDKRDLLQAGLTFDDTVVFVDDFAGTGQQAATGWREVMAELLPGNPTVYLVLVAASAAAKRRISGETPMQVESKLLLRDDDNIFSPACAHFTEEEKSKILRYCSRADRSHPKGFGDCGFVIVLTHRTPNNSIPILHANHAQWVGLFPRY